ncbi:transcriptional activator protein Pur-beta [Platysternon megacephalum]|uniref:Transcriptional activator protein Pur-beta n=1 Tax=Platysternon megacephalum TaxID=55544 RepID=A0A4D9DV26_9SAUR|nr:transcriptional activator protein Pur-beta [Platysternon megacephalum]
MGGFGQRVSVFGYWGGGGGIIPMEISILRNKPLLGEKWCQLSVLTSSSQIDSGSHNPPRLPYRKPRQLNFTQPCYMVVFVANLPSLEGRALSDPSLDRPGCAWVKFIPGVTLLTSLECQTGSQEF